MIDLLPYRLNFRGYPVAFATPAAVQRLERVAPPEPDLPRTILATLERMEDTAGPEEPSGWLFEAQLPAGDLVWLERAGGVRDELGHHEGYWTLYLPEER